MLWKGQVLYGMMMFDEFRAMDYLASRPEVDNHGWAHWACLWARRKRGGWRHSTRA
jgi:hypothetical protein